MSGNRLIHDQSNTINPYYRAIMMVLERLRWDIRPASWSARARLKSKRDIHPGKKAVILCNGPSLLKTDLSLLEGTFTFGLNKVNLLFPGSGFRPDCIVAVNPYVIEQNRDFYNHTGITLFLDSIGLRLGIADRDNTIFLHSTRIRRFARDCSMSINQGHTVTFVALQLAYHMGFSRVALIGCDHHYDVKGEPNSIAAGEGRDSNHFDPAYFTNGDAWQIPDLEASEESYRLARRVYRAAGREIYNCTAGGRLELFDRLDIRDFLRL